MRREAITVIEKNYELLTRAHFLRKPSDPPASTKAYSVEDAVLQAQSTPDDHDSQVGVIVCVMFVRVRARVCVCVCACAVRGIFVCAFAHARAFACGVCACTCAQY